MAGAQLDWRRVAMGRLVPYWITVLIFLWVLAFLYAMAFPDGYNFYDNAAMQMIGGYEATRDWQPYLLGMVGPSSLAACLCALLLTNHRLPESRLGWIRSALAKVRCHPPTQASSSDAEYGRDLVTHKVNQFGKGQPDFNFLAMLLVAVPGLFGALVYIPYSFRVPEEDEDDGDPVADARRIYIESVAYGFGWMSVAGLSFFLIPVTRHSVLLAAMGWSPVHALRIHIWAGYTSFVFMLVHATTLVALWFTMYDYPAREQVIPNQQCWTPTSMGDTEDDTEPDDNTEPNCDHVYANWTGLVAAASYIALWVSSLHWVRRRSYRLFHACHVVFGTFTILGVILHNYWVSLTLLPSITYYLASTSPTLIQALASQFRGGVTVRAVRRVPGSNGGCVEVEFVAHPMALAELRREPCRFVKVCVPQLSYIWHPFDVYTTPEAPTVKLMFRPIGRFTKALAARVFDPSNAPVTFLVDGFYRGADKVEQALEHDCVTLVAGGVAFTRYLSLLPALLSRIAAESPPKGSSKLKTIVIHWASREPGLTSFIIETYLSSILDGPARACLAAQRDLDIKVNVYMTSAGSAQVNSAAKSVETLPAFAQGTRTPVTRASSSGLLASAKEDDDVTGARESEEPHAYETSTDVDNYGKDDGGDTVGNTKTKGHPLELARMLPRRHARAIDNLPYFVALSSSTWFGYWYLFQENPDETSTFYDLARMTWVTMYAVLMYVAYGIVVETSVLLFRTYWPHAPVPEEDDDDAAAALAAFENHSVEKDGLDDHDLDGTRATEEGAVTGDASSLLGGVVPITYHFGRPTGAQLLEEARLASAPGVFVCGPPSLADTIKTEAAKENLVLGLTRFCLYCEPYEL